MTKTKSIYLGLVAVLLSPMAANADVIYDNGNPDTTNGYGILGTYWTADDFTLDSETTINSIGFYFQNYNGISGWNQDISYSFFQDNSGSLGSPVASGSGQNVNATLSSFPWCCGGGNAWLVSFDLASSLTLGAGTYWLQLTGASGGGSAWWVTTGSQSGSFGLTNFGGAGLDFAFYLVDGSPSHSVPEPGTLALLGLGLVGMAARRKKKV